MKEQTPQSDENDYKVIIGLLKSFLKTKKIILILVISFTLLGLLFTLSKPDEYSSRVLFITQDSSSAQSGGLGGIASLLSGGGIKASGTADLPTFLYPQIINSWEFRKRLFDIPLKIKNEDSLITFRRYALDKERLSPLQTLSKYTIGLPRLLFSKKNRVSDQSSFRIDSLEYITANDRKVLQSLRDKLFFSINKEDGTLEIKTTFEKEPVAAAQLAQEVQMRLQKEIIRYRIAKAQEKYNFIESQYKKTKQEYKDAQIVLANYIDRNRFNMTESSLIRKRQLENESALLYSVYSDLEQQRIAQSLKVKEDTPNFTVINPPTVPLTPDDPNKLITIIGFGMVGFLLALLRFVYFEGKEYVSKLWNET